MRTAIIHAASSHRRILARTVGELLLSVKGLALSMDLHGAEEARTGAFCCWRETNPHQSPKTFFSSRGMPANALRVSTNKEASLAT